MQPSDRLKGSLMSVLARNGDLNAAMEVNLVTLLTLEAILVAGELARGKVLMTFGPVGT